MNSDLQPTNPYTPPAAEPPEFLDAAGDRAGLLQKEAILRVLGISYLVSTFFWVIHTGRMAMMYSVIGWEVSKTVALFLWFTTVSFYCGYRLAYLRPGSRFLLTLATGMFLLLAILPAVLTPVHGEVDWQFIVQTIVELLVLILGLWVLRSRAGRFMLSSEYRPIVAATPQLQVWRTPMMIAGIIALLVSRVVSYI